MQSTNATVSPESCTVPVSRTAADQTINSNLKLNGETCATASAVVQAKPQTCDDLNPKYSEYTGYGEVVPYSNGPTYWKMNQGNDNARKNACEDRGGTWLDDYNVPGTAGARRVSVPRGQSSRKPRQRHDVSRWWPVGVKCSTSLNAGLWSVHCEAHGIHVLADACGKQRLLGRYYARGSVAWCDVYVHLMPDVGEGHEVL